MKKSTISEKVSQLQNRLNSLYDASEIYEAGLSAIRGVYTSEEYTVEEKQEAVKIVNETICRALKSARRAQQLQRQLKQTYSFAPNVLKPMMSSGASL